MPTCVDTVQYPGWRNAVNPINVGWCGTAAMKLLQSVKENALTEYTFFSAAYPPHIRPQRGWRLPYGAEYREWKRELIWDVHRQ